MKRIMFPFLVLALVCSLLTVTAAAEQISLSAELSEAEELSPPTAVSDPAGIPAPTRSPSPTEIPASTEIPPESRTAAAHNGGNPSVSADDAVWLASAQETVSWNGQVTNNVSDNNYTRWASPVLSCLTENGDGTLSRVEYVSGTGVLVETYRRDGSPAGTKTLEAELPLFGGIFAGSGYNFLVFGQKNEAESDGQEVLRIVKYSKDWTRLGAATVKGANTFNPFRAGSLRMAEEDGKLYIYTCHEMYQSSDGYHHQSNMTVVVSQDNMTVAQAYFDVMNIRQAGYVSHSFNQFVRTGGGYVYRVDHGDAHPRAVSITRCAVDGSITDVKYTLPLSIQGETGANDTGVSVGGFALSDSSCLIAGNSVDQSSESTYSAAGQRNIFLTVTDRNLDNTQVIWLTRYTSADNVSPRTPQLVECGNNRFLVLWEEYHSDTQQVRTRLALVDGSGNALSSAAEKSIRLSDCQPILLSDGLVAWYVTDGSSVTLYQVSPDNLSGTSQQETRYYGDLNDDGTITVGEITEIIVARSNGTLTEAQGAAADIDGNGTVTVGEIKQIIVARSRGERIARNS